MQILIRQSLNYYHYYVQIWLDFQREKNIRDNP